jgi:hypothetical protein
MRPLCLAGLAVALAAPTRQAAAQLGCAGASCTIEISMPVADVLRLTLSSGSVALGTPVEADFTAGHRDVNGAAVTVTARSNRDYAVQLDGVSPTFSYAGTLANPGKPASDLRWATSAAGLGASTSHFGATTTLMSRGPGSVTVPLFLRTLWSFSSDVPGSYSLAIRFTLSAP